MRWGFIFIVVIISCTEKKITSDKLGIDKMKQICWDLMVADELAQFTSTRDTTKLLKAETEKAYGQVFGVHNVTPEVFYKSLRYYQEQPELFKTLMDSVKAVSERNQDAISKDRILPPI